MYKLLFSAVFQRLSPELSHKIGFGLIRFFTVLPIVGGLLRRWLVPSDPVLRTRVFDLELPSPLGLAAGFDKDAIGTEALGALGFGFVEIGTLTAHPQAGNPRPRLFRLPADRALVNRMGFNNDGAAAAAGRLRARMTRNLVVGVNIGKTKIVPEAETVSDYVTSAEIVSDVADYLVINVSSPNTPGLVDLQAVERLRPLIETVRVTLDGRSRRRIPLLVKISPDLADKDVDAIADLALEIGIDGIIATNTQVSREHLVSDPADIEAAGAGGLSGPPVGRRSLEVLRRLYARVDDRVVLISTGGIETGADAWERICAGATLVQGYTGFIYSGPLWAHRINIDLAHLARQAGLTSIQQAVGRSNTAAGPKVT